MEGPIIRQFKASDVEAVYALHIAGLRQTDSLIGGEARALLDTDLQNIEEVYIANGGEFLVVTEGTTIVGMGGLKKVDATTGEIKRMRVEFTHQGKGIGKLILDRLIQRTKELKYKELILRTSAKQLPAHHLYESRGFTEYDRKDVYDQDTVYYRKDV